MMNVLFSEMNTALKNLDLFSFINDKFALRNACNCDIHVKDRLFKAK